MTYPFQQPDWVQESGKPYPGAEQFAETFQKNTELANEKALAKSEARKVRIRKQGEEIARQEEQLERILTLRSLETISPRNTFWLWDNRIPIGEITLVAGRGGIGKSLFLCQLVAWITVGECKGEYRGRPKNVVFIANEDSYEKTVVPRLLAAGADVSRVYQVDIDHAGKPGRLLLPEDGERLSRAIAEVDAVAVFIDPLSSNMSDRDRNSPEVRASYERLRLIAETSNVSIVGNAHLRKGTSLDILEGIMGSSEIGNVSRAAIGIVRDPDAEEPTMILSQCKNNYAPTNLKSYTYTIVEALLPYRGYMIKSQKIQWGSSTSRHVDDLLTAIASSGAVSNETVGDCVEWLRDYLQQKGGEAPRSEVIQHGMREGYSRTTIDRAAKQRIKVDSRPLGVGAARVWRLPRDGV